MDKKMDDKLGDGLGGGLDGVSLRSNPIHQTIIHYPFILGFHLLSASGGMDTNRVQVKLPPLLLANNAMDNKSKGPRARENHYMLLEKEMNIEIQYKWVSLNKGHKKS